MNTSPIYKIAVNPNIVEMEYAVRGHIPQRAAELRKQGRKTIPCNIGNPQALGQNPLTFYRQVLSLVEDPARIGRERKLNQLYKGKAEAGWNKADLLPDYVLDLAEDYLSKAPTGLGAYTESNGPLFIREKVADFIDKRDGVDAGGGVKSNPDNIFITNGASEGVKYIIELLITGKNDGIMIPIPQYPLYSATIRKCGGAQVNYYPEEDMGWLLNRDILEDSINSARQKGIKVKGIVVINPGNPTGAILDEKTIREVINFAEENRIVIMADEVYQENTYGAEFLSFAKALGNRQIPLFSFHSISKGFYGECGHRGGYLEVRNTPMEQSSNISFTDLILKQASVSLCSNTVGQLLVYLMVYPPAEGSEPYAQFIAEKQAILNDLYEKAAMIREGFKQMDGVECFGRTGAMYLFPRLNKLPKGTNDFDYCMNLLETTGLTTVNGSGFGQKAGTSHLRIAFLPPKELIRSVMPEWIKFHNEYVNR